MHTNGYVAPLALIWTSNLFQIKGMALNLYSER